MSTTPEKILEKHALKQTVDRINILRILIDATHALSTDELQQQLLETNKTTVYRNLELFTKKGILYQTDFKNGKAYFEYQHSHHHHITCENCGCQEEISLCIQHNIKSIEKKSKNFETINSHIVELFGACKKCK